MESWYKPKSYLHFDYRLNDSHFESVKNYVQNSDKVSKHSFYPFLTFKTTKYKMIENENGYRTLDCSDTRSLSYAAHMDSQIYSYYSELLSKIYEEKLKLFGITESVIAFRKIKDANSGENKSNIHLANDAFEAIKLIGECKVVALDVKGFFDNLDSEQLKKSWVDLIDEPELPPDQYNIFKSITTFSLVDRNEIYSLMNIPKRKSNKKFKTICNPRDFRELVRTKVKTVDDDGNIKRGLILSKKKGIPQGSPISAFLANVYMLEFDLEMTELMREKSGKYFRYCDDLFFILPISHKQYNIELLVDKSLNKIKLNLNKKKSDISEFHYCNGELACDKPIQYLGFMFDGKHKYIRPSSISRYRRKARKAIKLANATQIKHNEVRVRKGLPVQGLYRKSLYRKFFYSGRSNFISYGNRAALVMNSSTIKKQIKKLCNYIYSEVGKKNIKLYK